MPVQRRTRTTKTQFVKNCVAITMTYLEKLGLSERNLRVKKFVDRVNTIANQKQAGKSVRTKCVSCGGLRTGRTLLCNDCLNKIIDGAEKTQSRFVKFRTKHAH